jgi:hypothetical protein
MKQVGSRRKRTLSVNAGGVLRHAEPTKLRAMNNLGWLLAMSSRRFQIALLVVAFAAASGCALKPERPENVRLVDYHQKTTQCRKIKAITATQGAPPNTDVLAEAMGSAHKQVAAAGGNGIYIVSRTVEPGVSALVRVEALRCHW